MSQISSPEAIVEHHLQAMIEGDVDIVLQDYIDASCLVMPNATYKGLDELRAFFKGTIEMLPEGFWDAFTIRRQEVIGEVVYDIWDAHPWIPFGTDTFVIQNGKIILQTAASYYMADSE